MNKTQKQLEEEIKELENKTEIEFRGVLERKYPTPKYPITFCEDLEKLHITEALLAQKIEDKKKMMEIIEDVDIELMFTDIKDKEGNKAELSDELMEIIRLWWDKKSIELKNSVEEKL